jgi:hypothetical protein
MVLVSRYRKTFSGIVFLLLTALFSCEETAHFFMNCQDCLDSEPLEVSLVVRTNPKGWATIEISVYEGKLDDGLLFSSFYSGVAEFKISVPANREYTLTAKYESQESTFVAVDAVRPVVRLDDSSCEDLCYWVSGNIVNLKPHY